MRKLTQLLLALSLSSATAAWAGPCDVVIRNGVLDGICDFGLLYGKHAKLTPKFDFRPRHTIRLPNLVPDGLDYHVDEGLIEISLQVENQNWPDSLPFDAHVTVIVYQGGQTVGTHVHTIRFPGVPAGGTRSEFVAQIPLGNREYDNDVATIVMVDSPTASRARGEILESNEADNARQRRCRVYGTLVFDNSVTACD